MNNNDREIPYVIAIPVGDWVLWKTIKWGCIILSLSFWRGWDWHHLHSQNNQVVLAATTLGNLAILWFVFKLGVFRRVAECVRTVVRSARWILTGKV